MSLTAERRSLQRTVPSTSSATATRKQSTSASPIRPSATRSAAFAGFFAYQRRNGQGEIRECISPERLRAIFSQSAPGIVQADLTGRYLLANNRFCEILGYGESGLQAMRMGYLSFRRHRRGRPAL
ncbi:PAS domain S-box protein [Ensifer sp. ENS03]|uniref:PAS domain-containing protein n=1 Tax=Ensifer sp. ENS03 TaxID=2769283 RepID=UPI00353043CD